jgi:hypothetical protein
MNEPLSARRSLLQEDVLAKLSEPIRESPELEASLPDLISSVKTHGLEGLVAKRRDSRYEGRRTDSKEPWCTIAAARKPAIPVKGIATTVTATMDVLKRALKFASRRTSKIRSAAYLDSGDDEKSIDRHSNQLVLVQNPTSVNVNRFAGGSCVDPLLLGFECLLGPLVADAVELHYLAVLKLDGKLRRTRCRGARSPLVRSRRVSRVADRGLACLGS